MYIHLSVYLSVYIRLTCRGTHTCLTSASGKGKPQYTTTREQYFKNRSQSVCLCLSVTVPNLSVITYLYRSALHTTSLTIKRDHTIDKDAGRTGIITVDQKRETYKKQSTRKIIKRTRARPGAKKQRRSVKAECKAKHKVHVAEGNLKKTMSKNTMENKKAATKKPRIKNEALLKIKIYTESTHHYRVERYNSLCVITCQDGYMPQSELCCTYSITHKNHQSWSKGLAMATLFFL